MVGSIREEYKAYIAVKYPTFEEGHQKQIDSGTAEESQ
jgi:hypothetical protein